MFGGGVTESVMHPLVMAILGIVVLLTWVLPRRHVLGPMLGAIILIPLG